MLVLTERDTVKRTMLHNVFHEPQRKPRGAPFTELRMALPEVGNHWEPLRVWAREGHTAIKLSLFRAVGLHSHLSSMGSQKKPGGY